MRKLLPTAIAGIALLCASSAHATKLKIVLSHQFELKCGKQEVNMRPDDNGETMCVITGVGGSFAGEAEFASLSKDSSGNWIFHGQSCQPRTFVVVTCFRAE